MIDEVRELKPDEQTAADPPSVPLPEIVEAGQKPRRTGKRTKSLPSAPNSEETRSPAPPGPEQVATEGPAAGMTRSQALDRWGLEMGQQIWDAAAGRRPPFTRDLRGTNQAALPEDEAAERVVGRQQDRGPIHLLPRPLDFKLKPEQFFKYWRMLSQEELDRVKVYSYRLWPVIDVNQVLSQEELQKIARRQRKPLSKCLPGEDGRPGPLKHPFDPEHWREEIYHRWGAGDYSFSLNDTHPAIKRTICMTTLIGELRDKDTYPPALDHRTLVVADPANESYIRWCEMKGVKIPGRGLEEEEGEDVAATKILADTVERLTRDREPRRGNEADAVATVAKTVSETMAQAARTSNELLIRSIESQSRREDPLEFHNRVMEAAKTVVPPTTNNNGNLDGIIRLVMDSAEKREAAARESNNLIIQMLTSNQKTMEARLEATEKANRDLQTKMLEMTIQLHKPPDQTGQSAPMTPMTMMSEMGKMLSGMFSIVDKISDRSPRGAVDGGSPWSRIADKVIDAAPGMIHNMTLMRQAAAGVAGSAPAPIPPPAAEEEGEEDNSQPSEEEMAIRFLDQIEQPLIHALTTGVTGQEFGALLMKTLGADTYEFIASQPDDVLFQLLSHNQNIWGTVQKMSQRFVIFLQEFRQRDMVQQIFRQMNVLGSQQTQTQSHTQTQSRPSQTQDHRPRSQPPAPAPAPAPATAPATAPASADLPQSVPAQVKQRLKPGQRVVHHPGGAVTVEGEVTSSTTTDPPQAGQSGQSGPVGTATA